MVPLSISSAIYSRDSHQDGTSIGAWTVSGDTLKLSLVGAASSSGYTMHSEEIYNVLKVQTHTISRSEDGFYLLSGSKSNSLKKTTPTASKAKSALK
mmetsp:Transcript_12024/g.15011  ORF Transcript_12024/g.15011 Transcript_12024/m.15011 type:complete len:97 (+) Transcript_12024:415-705(+)